MIKRLAGCVREYKRDAILAPISVTLEVVMEVIIPLLMAKLINNGIEKGDMGYLLKIAPVLVAACLLSLCFGAMSGRFAARAMAGFGKNLRHDMYYNVQNFSFANIDKFSASSIVTRLTTDVTNVQNAFMMIIRIAVRAPIMLVFSLAAAFSISAKLSLIFVMFLPVLAVGMFLIIRVAHPIFRRVFKIYDKLNAVVQENLTGIRVVKSYVREEREVGKFNAVSQKIYQDFTKAEGTMAFAMPLMMFCMYGCMLMISWFGARVIILGGGAPGALNTGELTSLITYIMQILMSLMMFSMVLVMMTMSRASGERIIEILEEKSSLHNPEQAVTEVADGSIRFENVNFSYTGQPDKLCLKKISFEIKSGETIGIIGGTGSSKSSLVQLIPRLYDVTEGAVYVGGRDVREYDLNSLRDEVAMVLQKNVLFSGTITENLRWGNEHATPEQIRHACRLAQADEFIQTFPDGYDTYIEQGGTNVSGGQKQRLCIARALLKKPKILILDDSTSAVDTRTDSLIRRAFREEIPDTTKLIIAQRISSVEDADHIIVMDNGCINGFGTHEELIAGNKIYREVYESQQKGGGEDAE